MIYRISKTLYNNLLNGLSDGYGNWIIKPLGTHQAVVSYLRQTSGLMNITDVTTD